MTTPIAAAPSRPAPDNDQAFPKLTSEQVERVVVHGRMRRVERAASAVGEGSAANSFVHQALQE